MLQNMNICSSASRPCTGIFSDTFCPALLQPQATALLRVVLADRVGFGPVDDAGSFRKVIESTKADYEVKRSLIAQLGKIDE